MKTRGVTWYNDRIEHFTETVPEQAHAEASQLAAGLAAQAIRSKGTGALARDVARADKIGTMHRIVGSELPYASIQNSGGTIKPRNAKRMLIRGKRGGGRSSHGGPVVASATSVTIKGKHYLDAAEAAFPQLFINALRRRL